MKSETQNETVLAHELCPVDAYETEEQKTKRRVPKYYLIHKSNGNSESLKLLMYQDKKMLKEYLENNEFEKFELDPILILGHEVPITFNKIVKVDF